MSSDKENRESQDRFPKLKNLENGLTNYREWSVKAKSQLQQLKYWDLIEGPNSIAPIIPKLVLPKTYTSVDSDGQTQTITTPGNQDAVDAAEAAAKPWNERDQAALDKIKQVTAANRIWIVKYCKTTKQAWESLRSTLWLANRSRTVATKANIMAYTCKPEYNVAMWLEDQQKM